MSLFKKSSDKSEVEKISERNFSAISFMQRHAEQTFYPVWFKMEKGKRVFKEQKEVQAFFDELGAEGVRALLAHSKLQELLMIVSDWKPLVPPYDYKVSEDGSVSIGELK